MIRLLRRSGDIKKAGKFGVNFCSASKLNSFEVNEVKIPLGEGDNHYLAGKFWGDKSKSPILCIHGAQDTAGSFDRLIPLLPNSHSYLAYDLYGHGLSSTFPDGLQFNIINYLHHIRYLQMHFKIDKVSLIGHSSGANMALTYGALFPELVKMIIAIDGRQPFVYEPAKTSEDFAKFMINFYKSVERNRLKFKKSFTMDELCEKYAIATGGSIPKHLAPLILNRCVEKAEKAGKFYYMHDARFILPTVTGFHLVRKFSEESAIRIARNPLLMIECTKEPFMGMKPAHENIFEVLMQNKNFEFHQTDDLHHVHLTHPEKISKTISEFILKHDLNAKL